MQIYSCTLLVMCKLGPFHIQPMELELQNKILIALQRRMIAVSRKASLIKTLIVCGQYNIHRVISKPSKQRDFILLVCPFTQWQHQRWLGLHAVPQIPIQSKHLKLRYFEVRVLWQLVYYKALAAEEDNVPSGISYYGVHLGDLGCHVAEFRANGLDDV